MKFVKTLIILILVLVLALAIGKNIIAKVAIENGVKLATGVPLTIQDFRLSFLKTLVDITGLKLENPKGFEDKTMLDMPKIFLEFDLPALFKSKIHIKAIKIHLSEMQVIKNKDGKLNLDALKPVSKESAKAEEPAKQKAPAGKAPGISIDLFELKVGKVVYKDYSGGGAPVVSEFKINLDEQFKDVANIDSLVKIIIVKSLAGTTIAQLTNFDVNGLASSVSGTLSNSAKALSSEAAAKTQQAVGAATDQAQKVMSSAVDGLGNTLKSDVTAKTGTAVQKSAKALGSKAKSLTSGLASKVKIPSFGGGSSEEETQSN